MVKLTRKKRPVKKTVLIYAEGLDDEIFLKHLRGLYARDKSTAITIRRCTGGSADRIVKKSLKVSGDFNRRIVVLDNDKFLDEMERGRKVARKKGIILIENTPCLEAVFLSILNDGEGLSGRNSAWCKKKFEEKYIPKNKRSESKKYKGLFTKEILDAQIEENDLLKKVVSVLNGEF